MASPRRQHMKRERRERRRTRKLTVYDRLVPSFALAAAICLLAGIFVSWRMQGLGEAAVGTLGWLGLILAAGAVLLGYLARLANRCYLPLVRMGIWPGFVIVAVYVLLFLI